MSTGGQPLTVVRVPLAWTFAPERAALLVRDDERPFALIGRWAGGGALIGSEAIGVAPARPAARPPAAGWDISARSGGDASSRWRPARPARPYCRRSSCRSTTTCC